MPDLLDRTFLRGVGASAAVDATSAERAFIAVMAWGYAKTNLGPYRASMALKTPRAGERLLVAARTLANSGAVAAYQCLAGDCRLAFFGPAFVTKFLSFCQPPQQDPIALILDSLVSAWLSREVAVELDSVSWSASTYSHYLDLMQYWASGLECRPDELECCIFSGMSTERGNQWGRPRRPLEGEPLHRREAYRSTPHGSHPESRRPDPGLGSRPRSRPRPSTPARGQEGPSMQGKFREDVHDKLVDAARNGHTVCYSDLPGGRGHIGSYLYRIADYEKEHGRPPLTALVVRKDTGLPGGGFAIAARQVGYAKPGESDDEVWRRAVAEVFSYWSRSGDHA